jgi:hypothetical protein
MGRTVGLGGLAVAFEIPTGKPADGLSTSGQLSKGFE